MRVNSWDEPSLLLPREESPPPEIQNIFIVCIVVVHRVESEGWREFLWKPPNSTTLNF